MQTCTPICTFTALNAKLSWTLKVPLLDDMKAYVIEQSDYDIINSRHIYQGVCPNCKSTSVNSEDKNQN